MPSLSVFLPVMGGQGLVLVLAGLRGVGIGVLDHLFSQFDLGE